MERAFTSVTFCYNRNVTQKEMKRSGRSWGPCFFDIGMHQRPLYRKILTMASVVFR
jgi:hypothetical protein